MKKNSKRWNFGEILDLKYLKFFQKKSILLQNCLIKSLIHIIKQHKSFKNFLTTIDRQNRKKCQKYKKKSKSK